MTISRVRRLATAVLDMTSAPLDKRGKHINHRRKVSAAVCRQIDAHIRSFPAMKSHYSRKKQSRRRKYLSPQLSVAKMHELYVEKFEPGATKPLVSYKYYREYFNDNFNISFGYPRTDTCSMYDQLDLRLSTADDTTRRLIAQQKEIHLRKAETFYNSLRSDTRLSKQSEQIATISFDFQQNLPLPSLPVGVFFLHAPVVAVCFWSPQLWNK